MQGKTGKILGWAVMAYVLSGTFGGAVCSAVPDLSSPPDATATVTGNKSSANNGYHSITISTAADPTRVDGINNNADADMTVYLRDDFTKLDMTQTINGAKTINFYGIDNKVQNTTLTIIGKKLTEDISVTGTCDDDGSSNPTPNFTVAGISTYGNTDKPNKVIVNGDIAMKLQATATNTNTATTASMSTNVYGIMAMYGSDVTINGNVDINGTGTSTGDNTSSSLYGISTLEATCHITGDLNFTATSDAQQNAINGLMAMVGDNKVDGNVIIKPILSHSQGIDYDLVYSMFAVEGTNDLSASGKLHQIEGDMASLGYAYNLLTLDTADSYLKGNLQAMIINDVPSYNTLTLANSGTWQPVYDNRYGSFNEILTNPAVFHQPDYSVQNLNLNKYNTINLNADGIIDLTWDNGENGAAIRTTPRTMTIENLNGADGILRINSDLANNAADKLTIGSTGDVGSLKVQVAYDPFYTKSTTEGETLTGKAAVVDATSAANTVSVSAIPTEYGAYKFTPTVTTEDKVTYLTMLTNNGGTTPAVKTDPSTNALAAGSMGRHVYDAWLADTNNIAKRMGELRDTPEAKGGIWARMNRGKFSKGDDAYDYNGIQVGYDVDHTTKKGKTFTGFALDYLDGDTDAYRSSGTEKNTTFTLYHSYMGNNGTYYDFTAKYGHIYGYYNVTDLNDKYSDAGYGTNAWTFSGEYGHRKSLTNGMYVEPQLELIYGHIKGYNYTTSYPLEVSVDATKRFVTRLGVSVGKEFENKSSLYFTASWNHDFGGDLDYQVGDLSLTKDMPGNWGSFLLGGTARLGKKTNAFLQLEKLTGGMGSDLMWNMGLRYSF